MLGKKKIVIFLLLAFAVALLYFFLNDKKRASSERELSFQTYSVGNGWGYSIFASDTLLLIKQDIIPGLEGKKGFESEAKAAKTAEFVILKIKKGIFPPTLTRKELDSLEVL